MTLLFYFSIMVKYILAEKLFFENEKKSYWAYVIGFVIFAAFSFIMKIPMKEKHFVALIVILISLYFTLQGKQLNKFFDYLCVLFFIMISISGTVQFFYEIFFLEKLSKYASFLSFLIKDIMSILLLVILIVIKKKTNKDFRKKVIKLTEDKSNFVIICTALISVATIISLDYFKRMASSEKEQIKVLAISGIAYISIGVLGGIALYIRTLNDETKKLIEKEIMLKDMQKKYYEALLEKEKETRLYRHDMSNHLVCLSGLAEKGEIGTLIVYLNKMRGEMNRIKGRYYETGNEILDIMTNFYLPQLSEHINISLQASPNIKLDEMKICTIYANLLQNAVEELNSVPERDGDLRICFKTTDNVYKIMIENSIFREKIGFETQKKDKRNHGIGLKNVKNVVQELNGKMFISNNGKIFTVIVELNIN